MRLDSKERPRIDDQYRLAMDPSITGSGCNIYVQNAERHTHGIGTPDLGLAAWRSAAILNSITGKEAYPLPTRTAFTTFGLDPAPPRHVRSRQIGAPRGTVVPLKG
jgi:lysine N6-hydroxylase